MASLTGRFLARLQIASKKMPYYLSLNSVVCSKISAADWTWTVPDIQRQQFRCAGHSKWSNIKHVKGAKDLERSKEISKFISLMKLSVKEGGSPDPSKNSKLAQTISQIKDAKLPMAAFDKLLQNLVNKKEDKTALIPIKGPGNSVFIVELTCENLNRAKQDVNTVLRKNKGVLTEESVYYQFNHKGLVYCSEVGGSPVSSKLLESAVEHAIEAGADDVIFVPDHPEHGSVLEFSTSPSAFFKVKQALEALAYNVVYADIDYIPISPLELEDTDVQDVHKLYQKLSDLPEVSRISTNIV